MEIALLDGVNESIDDFCFVGERGSLPIGTARVLQVSAGPLECAVDRTPAYRPEHLCQLRPMRTQGRRVAREFMLLSRQTLEAGHE